MELDPEDKAREQVKEEEEEEILAQIRPLKKLPLEEQFSHSLPCLSGIGWIKNSLKEKRRQNLSKINRIRRSHE